MTAYYQDSAVTIYHGDASELWESIGCYDVSITDPPYGIDGSSGHSNLARAKGEYHGAFSDDAEYVRSVVVPIVQMLIKNCIGVILTPGYKNMMLYPQPQSFGAFYQPACTGLQPFGNGDAQPIFYYGKNPTLKNMGTPCSYQLVEAPPKNGHPCPKPFIAWKRLVSNFTLQHHVILDPFMGSGTTLRAAKDLGRKAIGIEIEERYCEIAAKRMEQEVLGLESICPRSELGPTTPIFPKEF